MNDRITQQDASFDRAVAHFNAGRLPQAEAVCRRLLSVDPGDADALHLLGLIADRAGHRDAGIELVGRAIAADGRNAQFYANLGLMLESAGQLDKAIEANTHAARIDPGNFAAWFNLGNEHRSRDNLDAAVEAYQTALTIRPTRFDILANLGGTLAARGDHADAVSAYRRALALAPNEAVLHSNLGNALAALGRHDEAVTAFEKATELEPDLVEALDNLAAAQLRTGDANGALAVTDRALKAAPGDRTALALRGVALDAVGDTAGRAQLLDYERFVQPVRVDCPATYESLDAFNAALVAHVTTHPTLTFEPGSKSTRGGSQSLNLLLGETGPIEHLRQAITIAVERYLETHPPGPGHPFLEKPLAGWRLNVWATVLDAQGHQLPHIHPAGWLSGVYYAQLPDAMTQHRGGRAGWIEFGRAPEGFPPTPDDSVKTIEPEEGLMLLFPSYFYHRTLPFDDDTQRVSIAFDVLPDEDYSDPVSQDDPDAVLAEVRKRYQAEDLDEAEQLCGPLVRRYPALAEGHYLKGLIANRRADTESAARHIHRASELAPGEARYFMDLGNCLRRLDRYDESLAAYRRGVELAPDDVKAHVSLATVYTDLGRFEEARASYRRAIELRPACGPAHYGLAFNKRYTPDDPDIPLMEEALLGDDLTDKERSGLHFALGRAYDDTGEPDKAFPHFAAGNRIKRAEFPFDLDEERANAQRLIAAFTPDVFDRYVGAGDPSELPVFIVGMPRSGTTLVEQILDSHPQVHGAGELNDLWRVVARIGPWLPPGRQLPEAVGEVRAEGWREAGRAYVETVGAYQADALRIVDKMPFNYTMLGLIRLMLPRARIIHCIRDPMDTCLSCYTTSFANDRGYTYDLTELGTTYAIYRALMDHWRHVLPGGFLDVSYERMTEDPESGARRLVDYLGLEWSDRCLAFHENRRPVSTASHTQVRRPAYRSSVGRWRRYEAHLGELAAALDKDPFAE